MHLFFSVGEPSGDQHAAHLIQSLKKKNPNIKCSGFGGPLMKEEGVDVIYPLTNLAVMGIWKVLPLLWTFIKLVGQANRYLKEHKPDAVILIDFPGFNWWIARKAKAAGIPVYYYLPPQLWAWGSWRIKRMRKYVDHILTGLSFEKKWYEERGLAAEYVGHPFFDEVADYQLDTGFCDRWKNSSVPVVGVLPGSRNSEIEKNWKTMLIIMKELSAKHQKIQFLVAGYKKPQLERCIELTKEENLDLNIDWSVGKTSEIIESSDCCLMVSGSVSLEMLARRKPATVIYSVGKYVYPFMRMLVSLDTITLPNLIAGKRLYPDWVLTGNPDKQIPEVIKTLDEWISHPSKREETIKELDSVYDEVVIQGASERTAEAILSRLEPGSPLSKAA